MRFKGIATQGRSNANQWVMSYVVTYSGDGVSYVPYKERRRVKVRDMLFLVSKHSLLHLLYCMYVTIETCEKCLCFSLYLLAF